jgi:membrane protein
MRARFKDAFFLFKRSFKRWWDRDPFAQSASIAYSSIFSLPGLMVVVVAVAGFFFGNEAVSGRLHSEITSAMGKGTADEIGQMISIAGKSQKSIIASIIGVVTIILGATGVMVEFQKDLNIIWEVKADPDKSGVINFLKTRLFSFALIISVAFLLLISLVLSSFLSAISNWVREHWSESLMIIFQLLNFIVSLGLITVLFALMFKILPDAKIHWRSVWLGAFVTSLLFVIGKTVLGLYFGKADPASGYGAAGSIVLILLWASYSSIIVLFGAEFTKVFSDHYYGEAPPAETAKKDEGRVK